MLDRVGGRAVDELVGEIAFGVVGVIVGAIAGDATAEGVAPARLTT